MTVSETSPKHVYEGTGITVDWPYSFPILDDSDLKVFLTAPGAKPILVTSGYLVDVDNSKVTFPFNEPGAPDPLPPIQTGYKITLIRVSALTQETEFGAGPIPRTVLEQSVDKLTMIVQEQQEALSRAVKFTVDEIPVDGDTDSFIDTLTELKTDAQSAASSAAAAEGAAESAAGTATTAAATATTKATSASNSAASAATSATTATGAASAAGASAAAAAASASQGSASASSAGTSATSAASSASSASTSAANAASSATSAASSASSAAASAAAAAASATAGIPAGGNSGQVMAKNSNADYDTHWSDVVNTAMGPANGSGHGVVVLNASVQFQSVLPGTTGNVLTSNGTDWVSSPAPTASIDTATDLGGASPSDSKISSQKAIKTYVDNKSPSINTATDLGGASPSDTIISSQKAIKTYADTKIAASALDTDGTLNANSDAKIASQKAVKSYVDTGLAAVSGAYTTANFTGTTVTATAKGFQRYRYTGSSPQTFTAFTLTSMPDAGMLTILGTSDTNTITIPDTATGLYRLNGPCTLAAGQTLVLMYDSGLGGLVEISRS